jgi:hypothetical protein
MAAAMRAVPGGSHFASHGFAGEDMKAPRALRAVMADTVFCPAPTGWYNPDSYRFSEALEVGGSGLPSRFITASVVSAASLRLHCLRCFALCPALPLRLRCAPATFRSPPTAAPCNTPGAAHPVLLQLLAAAPWPL